MPPTPTEATKKADVKVGSEIHLVHAKGHHMPAKVTKVLAGNKVNLEADVGEELPLVITSSPLDETGKLPDSWHLPESDAKGDAAKV